MAIFLLLLSYDIYLDSKFITIKDITISKKDLNSFDSITSSGQLLQLCDIDKEKCVYLTKP